jgi:hypothetical protein
VLAALDNLTITFPDLPTCEPLSAVSCPGDQAVASDCATGLGCFNTQTSVTGDCPDIVVECEDQDGNPVAQNGDCRPPGEYTITCKATDDAGNSAQCSFNVKVVQGVDASCITWHQPIGDPGASHNDVVGTFVFKCNRTIPIKVHVNGCDGADDTADPDITGTVRVFIDANCDGTADGEVQDIDANGVGGDGGAMVLVNGHLMYNLDTKTLPCDTEKCYILVIEIKRDGVPVCQESLQLRAR